MRYKNLFICAVLLCFNSFVSFADVEDEIAVYKKTETKKSYKKVIKASSLGHDSRFKMFPFIENGVFEVIALYDNTTYIEFEEGEIVGSVTNPKDDYWQFAPKENRLFFRPLATNADTQITVMTNKRIYFFEMYAKEPDNNFDDNYTFYYQFSYPNEEEQKTIRKYSKSILPNIDLNPEQYNFNYTISGHFAIYPMKIFDDGEFTYFEFRDKGGIIPAIFTVDSGNYESLVNFRMIGSYVVVEAISPRFTLRNGMDVVCVFNENIYEKPEEKKTIIGKIKGFFTGK
jgi:type IV secretion system protein VirB9